MIRFDLGLLVNLINRTDIFICLQITHWFYFLNMEIEIFSIVNPLISPLRDHGFKLGSSPPQYQMFLELGPSLNWKSYWFMI